MQFRNMKIYFILTGAVIFLNLQHFSAEECPTTTKCLPQNLTPAQPLEFGILYDLVEGQSTEGLQKIDDIVCQLIKEFGNSVSFRRYPGATVQATADGGIKCSDDCWRIRDNACQGFVDDNRFTQCYPPDVSSGPVENCVDKKLIDPMLKDDSALRCKLGIPTNKIPAVILDKTYAVCQDITSADQLKTILCASYGKNLKGC